MENSNHEKFMRAAIALSIQKQDEGSGPFGCVITLDEKVIAEGWNQVTNSNDPTAHAEVVAIRSACKHLNNFSLEGCVLYTSCEPCPMCLGAIYWSRVDKIYFANSKEDAANIDFDDQFIYEELDLPMDQRKLPMKQMLREEALEAFKKWASNPEKTEY